jgi:hypothetical protein
MSKELKFDLTLRKGASSCQNAPWLEFEAIEQATSEKTAYMALFSACGTPRCACLSARVSCAKFAPGDASSGTTRFFWLDLREKAVQHTPEIAGDPLTLMLAETVCKRLDAAGWELLMNWFWDEKIRIIETADASEIPIDDLPDAEDGDMISFAEVFPLGLSLNFSFANAEWAANEAYCVQPKCDCEEMALNFLRLKDAEGRTVTDFQDVPDIRYDYRTHRSTILSPGPAEWPPTGELLAALRGSIPDLDLRLRLHHTLLRSLYKRHHQSRAVLRSRKLAGAAGGFPKVGRNDPCRCGTGKKHKKCCGK